MKVEATIKKSTPEEGPIELELLREMNRHVEAMSELVESSNIQLAGNPKHDSIAIQSAYEARNKLLAQIVAPQLLVSDSNDPNINVQLADLE